MSDSTAERATADEEEEEATTDRAAETDRSHLDGVEDGCGCAEVWEHLSEHRDTEASSD